MDSPVRAIEAFLAVMAWGYGTRAGYGPYRTQRLLATDKVGHRLQLAARRLREGGAVDGYRALGGEARIKWLGPAFGTKYLHFCSTADSEDKALILDRLVADFLNQNSSERFNPVPWSVRTYGRYLELMRSWAHLLRVSPEELEQCLFTEESRQKKNQWV